MTYRFPFNRPDAFALALIAGAVLAWTAWAGKDLSWDVLNHHLYLPFSLFSGRFASDYFGAGPQAYQNPFGYIPAYLLIVAWQWPGWAVGVALASLHSLCIFVVYRMAARLWAGDAHRWSWVALACALAAIAPPFLYVVGTTSIDPTAALLVMVALALMLGESNASKRRSLAAGCLVGLAFAMKPTNAVFVLALGALGAWRWALGLSRWKDAAAFSAGVALGVVLGMGWWSVMLWERFGNPIFPLYNNIFQSPYAPIQAVVASRFVPETPWDYVARFWNAARPKQFIWIEAPLPDARPLALAAMTIFAATVAVVRIARRRVALSLLKQCLASIDAQLIVFAIVSYLLWMKTSGNARYAIPLLLVVGLLLARAAWASLSLPVGRAALAVVVVLQFAYHLDTADARNAAVAWRAGPYVPVRVPERLVEKPFLHVTLGLQTHAFLAPYMHRGGALMNPIGQISLPTDGPIGARVNALLANWSGRTRILMPAFDMDKPGAREATHLLVSSMLYRLNLAVDWSDCLDIDIGAPPDIVPGRAATKDGKRALRVVNSCRAIPRSMTDPSFESERAIVDRVFNAVEASCPSIFGPPGFVSERGTGKWQRYYANTDASVVVSFTEGVFAMHARSNIDRNLGTIEEILAGKSAFQCRMWSLLAPD